MKNIISNIIKYILQNYPHKSELSTSRLTKMLYLADWKSAIENNCQITDATWHFHHYGPYVDDFLELAKNDKDIKITNTNTMFGGRKQEVALSELFEGKVCLNEEHKEIIDFVIKATKDKNYEDFIKLVYSTYPVVSSSRYSDLNLVEMAKQYKALT